MVENRRNERANKKKITLFCYSFGNAEVICIYACKTIRVFGYSFFSLSASSFYFFFGFSCFCILFGGNSIQRLCSVAHIDTS